MVKRIFHIILIFCVLMPFPAMGKVYDRVVGVVNGDMITLSDLDTAMPYYGMANVLDEGNPLDKEIRLRQARKEVLDLLIEEKLLQSVARRFGITVDDEVIDKAIERMKQDGNISDEQVKKELVEQGFTVEGYRHFLAVQIRRARIIEAAIKPQVSMTEEKVRNYYQSHADSYLMPEVRISQILIQVPSEPTAKDWEQAKKKMTRVLERLNKGATFAETAAPYSDDAPSASSGGDLGFFKKGEILPMLEGVVFNMAVGEVSGVVQSSQGLHLFKVTEKKQGLVLPFEEIKNRVMEDYYREEVIRLYAKWLEDLKSHSDVEKKL